MPVDREAQIREFFERNANVAEPVQEVRRKLNISEANVVESIVLKSLNEGRMELTPRGVRLRVQAS
jgi:hypothetical protein